MIGAVPAPPIASAERVVGLGTDVTDVAEVEASVARFGDRYLRRVFTPAELDASAGDGAALAGLFAVKEAAMKALDLAGADAPWTLVESRPGPGTGSGPGPADGSQWSPVAVRGAAAESSAALRAARLIGWAGRDGPRMVAVVLALGD